MGGGCILSNDDLEELKLMQNTLEVNNTKYLDELKEYARKYYRLDKLDNAYHLKLKRILFKYINFYNNDIFNDKLLKNLDNLENICKNRERKFKIYRRKLKHSLIIEPKISPLSVAWRYTFRFLGDREKFLNLLRKENINCSSWYEGNDKIFGKEELKNTRILEKELVNLWLDESTSEDEIYKNIVIILRILRENF